MKRKRDRVKARVAIPNLRKGSRKKCFTHLQHDGLSPAGEEEPSSQIVVRSDLRHVPLAYFWGHH